LNTLEHQPAKIAAMEGIWETKRGAALKLFGWPDEAEEKTKFAIEIPKLSSLILTHDLNGEVKGLKEWHPDERPPVAIVFWSFRIMVGIGVMMVLTGVFAAVLYFRKRLFETRWFFGGLPSNSASRPTRPEGCGTRPFISARCWQPSARAWFWEDSFRESWSMAATSTAVRWIGSPRSVS